MTKFAQRVALLALMTLGAFTTTAHAQKIAVIDTKAVLAGLPEAQAAEQRLQGVSKAWQDSLQMMQTAYQAKLDTYQKMGDITNADAKKKQQEDLAGLENSFMKFRESKFGQTGELAAMQQQLLAPIFDKLKGALQNYAKREKLSVILDKATAVFVDPSVDLTDKFAEYVKTTASK